MTVFMSDYRLFSIVADEIEPSNPYALNGGVAVETIGDLYRKGTGMLMPAYRTRAFDHDDEMHTDD